MSRLNFITDIDRSFTVILFVCLVGILLTQSYAIELGDKDNTLPTDTDLEYQEVLSINAIADDFRTTPFEPGGDTASVLTNDNANGSSLAKDVLIDNATLAITVNGGLIGITINKDGTLNIPAGPTPGSYEITYQICLISISSICDTAVASIIVEAIDAIEDDFSKRPAALGGMTVTVFANDNASGTSPATDALIDNATLRITSDGGLKGVSINSNGTLNIPTRATPGSYDVTYHICLTSSSTLCDTAVATVLVDKENNDDKKPNPIALTTVTNSSKY